MQTVRGNSPPILFCSRFRSCNLTKRARDPTKRARDPDEPRRPEHSTAVRLPTPWRSPRRPAASRHGLSYSSLPPTPPCIERLPLCRLQCSAVGRPHAWRAISALPPVATPPHTPSCSADSDFPNYQLPRSAPSLRRNMTVPFAPHAVPGCTHAFSASQ